MSLIIRPKLKCPHCGTDNATMLTIDSVIMNRFFIRCDVEIGGCDELFVRGDHATASGASATILQLVRHTREVRHD